MPFNTLEVSPSNNPRQVSDSKGSTLAVPDDWALLPPGDAALSRRIKKDGPSWTVIEMKGRKRFSRGIWAPSERIETLRAALEVERADPSYQKKLTASRARRAKEQANYAVEFEASVLTYLNFNEPHQQLAQSMAKAIADHAVPVGSGTVARTQRIPIERGRHHRLDAPPNNRLRSHGHSPRKR